MVALSGQDEVFYLSCIIIFLSISWWIEPKAQLSSNISQKQTDNVSGRLNRPDRRDYLVLMKLPLFFKAAHKCLTLGSAYKKDFHDLKHLWLNTALIMHSLICKDRQITIIDPDDAISLY